MKLVSRLALCIGTYSILCGAPWPYGYLASIAHQSDSDRALYCLSGQGFMLRSLQGDQRRELDTSVLHVSAQKNKLYLYDMPLMQHAFWLDTPDHAVQVCGIDRPGALYISINKQGLSMKLIGNAQVADKHIMRSYFDDKWHVSGTCANLSAVAQENIQAVQESIADYPHTCSQFLFMIRVLLDAYPLSDTHSWTVSSPAGFYVYDPTKPGKPWCIKKSSLKITYKKNRFYLADSLYNSETLMLRPVEGDLIINDIAYQGESIFTTDTKHALCINGIDLESYVCSVLKSESWPGWPLEINKVLAIVIRTYALAQAKSAIKSKRVYHIKNTNAHQTYRGAHTSDIIRKAVDETRNMVIMYQGEPILAMFDACCGGVLTKHIQEGIDFEKAPYLARGYPCLYCKECKIYQWQTQYDISDFLHHCNAGLSARHIHDIKVTKRDGAGLVLDVAITGKQGKKNLSGRQLYSRIPNIKSYSFDLKIKGKKVIIQGNGLGHHLGLCQWGAREMVRRGLSHVQIVAFYYPKTQLVRLK